MKTNVFINALLPIALLHPAAASGQSISGVVNSYYQVSAVSSASNSLSLNSVSGLSIGSKVLLIQMKGGVIDATNAASFGNITAINSAGTYEFNYICGIAGNTVLLEYQMLHTYDPAQQVQLVSVPVYGSVTLSGTVTSIPWDPVTGTGGIVAIEATNTIFLNADIDVSGQGFQGGALVNYPSPFDCSWAVTVDEYYLNLPDPAVEPYHTGGKKGEGIAAYITGKEYGKGRLANGGGGGNNNNTGGAGGGNYGKGGDGGQRINEGTFFCHGKNPGLGGLSLSAFGYTTAQNKIFMGGGGGAGHENNAVGLPGGNGGGIVVLTAAMLTGSGNAILANGSAPINLSKPAPYTVADGDGGGGGGAGGTIILNINTIGGSIPVQANGGRGSDASNAVPDCTGPGGGGGAGVIWTAGASFSPAITASLSGGSNGVVSATSSKVPSCVGSSNLATAGDNGLAQTNYTAPMGTAPVCTILPVPALQYFRGNITADGALLVWQMNEVDNISAYRLETTMDLLHYSSIASISNSGEKNFSFADQHRTEGTVYYRLTLLYRDGSISYSAIVALSRRDNLPFGIVSLQPNPAVDQVTLVLSAKKAEPVTIVIYNAYGQNIAALNYSLNMGYSNIHIPLGGLSSGTYFLFIKGRDVQVTRRFTKTR